MTYAAKEKGLLSDPSDDLVPMTVAIIPGGCRAVRCETVGTFTGVTIAGNSRTVTMYFQGEVLLTGFTQITNIASGSFSYYP